MEYSKEQIHQLLSQDKKKQSVVWRLLKPILFVLLPLGIALSFLPGPGGQPLLNMSSVIPNAETFSFLKPVFDKLPYEMNPITRDVRVYRWQDENGQWHFSEAAPESVNAEAMLIDPETNLIGSTPLIDVTGDSKGDATGSYHRIDGKHLADEELKAQEQLAESLKKLESGQTTVNPLRALSDTKAAKIVAEKRARALDNL